MTLSIRNRFRGAMLGVHIGDALGAPYEWTWTPERIKADMDARGGLVPHEYEPFDYIEPWKNNRMVEKGQPTDDSELAAALAVSLIEKKGFDAEDVYNRLRAFIVDRKSILTELAYGSGSTLRAALDAPTYQESLARFKAGTIPTPPSNGSLMRSVAVALAAFPNEAQIINIAKEQSWLTHRDPSAVAACVAYSLMMGCVLNGMSPQRAWEDIKDFPYSNDSAMGEILNIALSKPDYERDMKGGGPDQKFGQAVLSLRVAVWASVEATNFADGIIKSISVGGDTDTYGAIAGGILGAHFGLKGIPRPWQDAMQGRQTMLDLADRLYETFHR